MSAHASGIVLSNVDKWLFIASCAGATALYFLRKHNQRVTERAQFLMDGLSVGTVIILALMLFQALVGGDGALAQTNGYLIAMAFLYSAGMIGLNLWKSVARIKKLPSTETGAGTQ